MICDKIEVSIFDKLEEIQKVPILFKFEKIHLSTFKSIDLNEKIIEFVASSFSKKQKQFFEYKFICTKIALFKSKV